MAYMFTWVIEDPAGQFLQEDGSWRSNLQMAARFNKMEHTVQELFGADRPNAICACEVVKVKGMWTRTERQILKKPKKAAVPV